MAGPVNVEWYEKMGWQLPDGMIHPFDFEKIMINVSVGYNKERQQIFNYLKFGTGIMILSSPPGFGKTHLLAWLEREMKKDENLFPVIYYTPPETTGEFVKGLCTQMYSNGLLEVPFFQKLSNMFGGADNYLSRITKSEIPKLISNQKKTIVILCDEAQNADPKILNEFKVLRDHPESGDKVRIILAGYKTEKVDLFKKLEATIQDRVSPSNKIYLTGITRDNAHQLIRGRLNLIKAEQPSFFDKHLDRIYRFSGKRPREILKICKEIVDYCAMNGFLNLSNSIVSLVLSKFVGSQVKVETRGRGKKKKQGPDFSELSENMYSIIKVLADHPGSTKEEIAKRTDLSALTINTLIWRMTRDKEYLERFAEAGIPIPVIDVRKVKTKKRGRNPSVYSLSNQAKVYFAET